MFCGSASGKLLPPHVIYEAKNIYKNWTEGVLEVTQSGWFDKETFEEWFRHIFIPVAKSNKVLVLIGDTLSRHYSPDVLRLYTKHNVKFICLPPNSTNNIQPLDVTFFFQLRSHGGSFSTSGQDLNCWNENSEWL